MSETKTGTIYKISTPKSEKVYVGSTTQTINKRLSHHKYNKNCMAQKLLELGECKIEALEVLYNCTKEELRIKEQHYLELLEEKAINKKRAYTTKDQRKKDMAENDKRWRVNNPDKRREARLAKNENPESRQ